LKLNSKLLKLGQDLTNVEYHTKQLIVTYVTLDLALKKPFKIKGRFAREGAMYVAICASQGWITNCIEEDTWGDRWGISVEGMETLKTLEGLIGSLIEEEEEPT